MSKSKTEEYAQQVKKNVEGITLPPTEKAQEGIESVKRVVEQQRPLMGPHGQKLASDIQGVAEATEALLEKNKGEKIQKLFEESKQLGIVAGEEGTKGVKSPMEGTENIQQQAQQVYNSMKNLVFYILRSGELRGLVVEWIDFFQKLSTRVIEKGSEKAKQQTLSTKQPETTKPIEKWEIKETKEEIQEGLQQFGEEIKGELQNKQIFTEEDRKEMARKFSELIRKLKALPDYQILVQNVFSIFDEMRARADAVAEKAQENEEVLNRLDRMWKEAKDLMEEFTGKGSVDSFVNSLNEMYEVMKNDEEAKNFFYDLRRVLEETYEVPETMETDEAQRKFENLMDRGNELLSRDKYRNQFDRVLREGRKLVNKIKEDSTSKEFSTRIQQLGRDLATDWRGRPSLAVIQQSFNELKTLLYPMIRDQLRSLKIPKVQGSNETYDYSIEGLEFVSGEILPEYVDISWYTDERLNLREIVNQFTLSRLRVQVSHIAPCFKNVHFSYRRKSFPHIEDSGVADVDMRGDGLTLQVIFSIQSVGNDPFRFSISRVYCRIDDLTITVKEAEKHSIIDKIASKLFVGSIRESIEKSIVENLYTMLKPLSTSMNEFFQRRPLDTLGQKLDEGINQLMSSTATTPGLMQAK